MRPETMARLRDGGTKRAIEISKREMPPAPGGRT
jgi:hypothetical protein